MLPLRGEIKIFFDKVYKVDRCINIVIIMLFTVLRVITVICHSVVEEAYASRMHLANQLQQLKAVSFIGWLQSSS